MTAEGAREDGELNPFTNGGFVFGVKSFEVVLFHVEGEGEEDQGGVEIFFGVADFIKDGAGGVESVVDFWEFVSDFDDGIMVEIVGFEVDVGASHEETGAEKNVFFNFEVVRRVDAV